MAKPYQSRKERGYYYTKKTIIRRLRKIINRMGWSNL